MYFLTCSSNPHSFSVEVTQVFLFTVRVLSRYEIRLHFTNRASVAL